MTEPKVDTLAYEAEAAAARQRIASTIGDIQHRLNPKTIANEAMDAALERGAAAARSAGQAVREHTVGLSIVGAVLGVFVGARKLTNNRKSDDMTQYDDEFDAPNGAAGRLAGIKEKAGQVRDTVAFKADAARDYTAEKLTAARQRAGETWETARERAGEYTESAKVQAQRARAKTAEGVDRNPLTAALIGAAAGAIIGALLPRTRRENQALGRTRDDLAEKAKSAARAARDAGQARFDQLGVKEQAKAQFREFKGSASEIARSAKDAATKKPGYAPLDE